MTGPAYSPPRRPATFGHHRRLYQRLRGVRPRFGGRPKAAMALENRMRPIHPGEILTEEFLRPLGMSANELAQVIEVPTNRVSEIAAGRRSSPPTRRSGWLAPSERRPTSG